MVTNKKTFCGELCKRIKSESPDWHKKLRKYAIKLAASLGAMWLTITFFNMNYPKVLWAIEHILLILSGIYATSFTPVKDNSETPNDNL